MGGWGAMSLKTLAAYSVLMLAKSWKTASDFHVPAPKIPKTRNFRRSAPISGKFPRAKNQWWKHLDNIRIGAQFLVGAPKIQNPPFGFRILDFTIFAKGSADTNTIGQCQNCIKLYKIDTWDVWHRDILWWTFPEVNAAEGNFFLQFHVSAHVAETGQIFGHQPRRHITESQDGWIAEKKLGLVSDKIHYTWVLGAQSLPAETFQGGDLFREYRDDSRCQGKHDDRIIRWTSLTKMQNPEIPAWIINSIAWPDENLMSRMGTVEATYVVGAQNLQRDVPLQCCCHGLCLQCLSCM